MKNFLLLVFLTWSIAINAQIIDIPDANFKNVLVNTNCADLDDFASFESNVDLNNDGEIEVSEAQLVFGLNLEDQEISNLNGIEFFVNLKELRCKNNQLTTLDLQSLTNLEMLLCSHNELNSLNIDGLINLWYLDFDSNNLTSIDISSLSGLITLWCQFNDLTSLEIDGLTNLTYLTCGANNLTSLTIPPNLDSLERISCSFNDIDYLYVPSLPNLETLLCRGNDMTQLSMGALPKACSKKINTSNK